MKTNTSDSILAYIRDHNEARAHDLAGAIGISSVALHKQLKKLIATGGLQKRGKPPLVFYFLALKGNTAAVLPELDAATTQLLDDHFLTITAEGRMLRGITGFMHWANLYKPRESIHDLVKLYVELIREKSRLAPLGWIDVTEKLIATFPDRLVDNLFIADTYSDPIFGRTRLAKLVMYAKQTEHAQLVYEIARHVEPLIDAMIKHFHIDAIGYIPPTVPRRVQFMNELAKALAISIPKLDLVKVVPGAFPIAQKSLAKLSERIINAQGSIFIQKNLQSPPSSILLIDDVVGSGASFQETARKLRLAGMGKRLIVGFAVVGNIKGYEIVRQV